MKSRPPESRPDPEELTRLITSGPAGVHLAVRVIPRAARTEIAGIRHDALLVRLAAPPVAGAANQALVTFLAGLFDVPRRCVTLVSGDSSRVKRVAIEGMTPTHLRQSLMRLLKL